MDEFWDATVELGMDGSGTVVERDDARVTNDERLTLVVTRRADDVIGSQMLGRRSLYHNQKTNNRSISVASTLKQPHG